MWTASHRPRHPVPGLIVAIAVPRVVGYLEGAKVKAAQIQLSQIEAALDLGDFPTEAQGLKLLVEKPTDAAVWNGPDLSRADSILDPWGHTYLYKRQAGARTCRLYSLGADGVEADPARRREEGGDGR